MPTYGIMMFDDPQTTEAFARDLLKTVFNCKSYLSGEGNALEDKEPDVDLVLQVVQDRGSCIIATYQIYEEAQRKFQIAQEAIDRSAYPLRLTLKEYHD